jgi:hypothetical protein
VQPSALRVDDGLEALRVEVALERLLDVREIESPRDEGVPVYRKMPVTEISRFWMCSTGSIISGFPSPTSTACPAGRTALMPECTARGAPEASTKASTSSPAVARSVSAGSMTRVAP